MSDRTCTLLAVVALAWANGCGDGAPAHGGGNGGDAFASGANTGSGSAVSGGSNAGGNGAGGTGADHLVRAFCVKYETDCGFSASDGARFASSSVCETEAQKIFVDNEKRFGCMMRHLVYVTSMSDLIHCTHAKGEGTCSEAEWPN